jgi:small GTP-binding protein
MFRFKLVLVGDCGVGKTALVNRLIHPRSVTNMYIPTIGVDVFPIVFKTTYGDITFNVWDISGKNEGLTDGYYSGANCCILMIDLSKKITSHRVDNVKAVAGDIPVAVCTNADTTVPFLRLARKLTGHEDLDFLP